MTRVNKASSYTVLDGDKHMCRKLKGMEKIQSSYSASCDREPPGGMNEKVDLHYSISY